MRWLAAPDDALFFARDPGFVFAVNFGASPVPLPPHSEILVSSGPLARAERFPPTRPCGWRAYSVAFRCDG